MAWTDEVLRGLGTAVYEIGREPTKLEATAYVLKLNARERNVTVIPFKQESLAQLRLFEEEKASADDPSIQVVQVSVERMQALRTAFPNYYLDTTCSYKRFAVQFAKVIRTWHGPCRVPWAGY
jgi:hypothetical protein